MNNQTSVRRHRHVAPLLAFVERAQARAFLWSIGEYDLREAISVLERDADRDGLRHRIGDEALHAILLTAFGSVELARAA